MPAKVLLADDSPTIQKVIKITLAKEDFEIIECESEQVLLEKVEAYSPRLVLLDFGLSEEKSGYELAKEIRQANPDSQVLMLYGTFDTIDEDALNSAGVSEKVVKPFDSSKFVSICHDLISKEGGDDQSIEIGLDLNPIEGNEETEQEPLEQDEKGADILSLNSEGEAVSADFSVSSPHFDTEETSDVDTEQSESLGVNEGLDESPFGSLDFERTVNEPFEEPAKEDDRSIDFGSNINPSGQSETFGLGVEVPGVIGEAEDDINASFPPVIADEYSAGASESFDREEEERTSPGFTFDSSSLVGDTESMNSVQSNDLSDKEGHEEFEGEGSLPDQEDLEYPDLDSINSDELDNWAVNHSSESSNQEEETEMSKLALEEPVRSESELNLLRQEVESEYDSNQLWQVDFEGGGGEEISDSTPMDEIVQADGPTIPTQTIEEPASLNRQSGSQVDTEELLNQLKPVIKEAVKEFCRENIEKIAWDVIPDLAENLVREQLEEITQKVLD